MIPNSGILLQNPYEQATINTHQIETLESRRSGDGAASARRSLRRPRLGVGVEACYVSVGLATCARRRRVRRGGWRELHGVHGASCGGAHGGSCGGVRRARVGHGCGTRRAALSGGARRAAWSGLRCRRHEGRCERRQGNQIEGISGYRAREKSGAKGNWARGISRRV